MTDFEPTGPEDPCSWYRTPLLGSLYWKRLRMVAGFLPRSGRRALELGYGSGIFLPELLKRFREVWGIDLHGRARTVLEKFREDRERIHLMQGSWERLPFQSDVFDAVVAVSVLGYLKKLDAALEAIKKVLRPGGGLVLGFPTVHWYTRPMVRYYGRRSHRDLMQAIEKTLGAVQWTHFPCWISREASLYLCCLFKKKA